MSVNEWGSTVDLSHCKEVQKVVKVTNSKLNKNGTTTTWIWMPPYGDHLDNFHCYSVTSHRGRFRDLSFHLPPRRWQSDSQRYFCGKHRWGVYLEYYLPLLFFLTLAYVLYNSIGVDFIITFDSTLWIVRRDQGKLLLDDNLRCLLDIQFHRSCCANIL